MNAARFKNYDYGVMGLFVLVIIGVSLDWYRVSASLFGESIGVGASGWRYALGVLVFIVVLAALVVVVLKAVLPGNSLPAWYQEGVILMGLGGLATLFTLIRIIDKPGRGLDLGIGYGAGIFITFIASLLLIGCGYLAFRDKSLAPAGPGRAPVGGPYGAGPYGAPPYGASPYSQGPGAPGQGPPGQGPAAPGVTGPGAPSAKYCQGCGTPLDPGAKFCRSCGKPQ